MALTRHEAKQFIKSLLNLRAGATDEQAYGAPAVYPEWKSGVNYTVDERVLYKDVLYKVLQAHTSQEDWMPNVAVSMFAKVLIPDATQIYPWEQPDSTNTYKKGDKVTYEGKTWISTVDNNSWVPGVYGWEVITE